MNVSKHLRMEGIPNIRDLGGIKNTKGKTIRKNALYRSETLNKASIKDLMMLSDVKAVYDFRSKKESALLEDAIIPGAEYLNLPILDDRQTGGGNFKNDEEVISFLSYLKANPDLGFTRMKEMYRQFVLGDLAKRSFSFFLKDLLKRRREDDKATLLYHCTSGKDRCGFASALILEILEVDRKDIYDDYLLTSKLLGDEFSKLMNMELAALPSSFDKGFYQKEVAQMVNDYCKADVSYLQAAYEAMDKEYGGVMGFIEKGLGLDQSFIDEFRRCFLD